MRTINIILWYIHKICCWSNATGPQASWSWRKQWNCILRAWARGGQKLWEFGFRRTAYASWNRIMIIQMITYTFPLVVMTSCYHIRQQQHNTLMYYFIRSICHSFSSHHDVIAMTNMSNYALQFDLCIYYFVLISTSFHYSGCSRATRIRRPNDNNKNRLSSLGFWSPLFFVQLRLSAIRIELHIQWGKQ